MKMSMSLDGFVAGQKGENDWVFKSSDETSLAWSVAQVHDTSLIIMGRKSFEMMSPYWPTATGPFAEPMNTIPKGVFTKNGFAGGNLPNAEKSAAVDSWNKAKVFDGDLTEEIKKLKGESGKPIVALGGGGFMQSLIATGLIDEYRLAIHPVILGSGVPLFQGLARVDLKLVEAKSFPKGIVVHVYQPG
jgi:dihydrofolate reductase